MSEKEKARAEELAKIMNGNKPLDNLAVSFVDGFVQGFQRARESVSADPVEKNGGKEDGTA